MEGYHTMKKYLDRFTGSLRQVLAVVIKTLTALAIGYRFYVLGAKGGVESGSLSY